MKHVKKALALSGLLVLLTFSAALGQSDRQTIIYIPFNFTAGEKSFPAGKYVIEQNRKDSDLVWVIRRKDNVGKALILTRPVRANETVEETRLVFHKYDDLYFLAEFWTPGSNWRTIIRLLPSGAQPGRANARSRRQWPCRSKVGLAF